MTTSDTMLSSGRPAPCNHPDRCLHHVIEDPLGCYDVRRYDGDHDRVIADVLSIHRPDGWSAGAGRPGAAGWASGYPGRRKVLRNARSSARQRATVDSSGRRNRRVAR